jgi:hypothetical protein
MSHNTNPTEEEARAERYEQKCMRDVQKVFDRIASEQPVQFIGPPSEEEPMNISYVSDELISEEMELGCFDLLPESFEYSKEELKEMKRLRRKIMKMNQVLNSFSKMFQIIEDERWYVTRKMGRKVYEEKRYIRKLCDLDGREFDLACLVKEYRIELRKTEVRLARLKCKQTNI